MHNVIDSKFLQIQHNWRQVRSLDFGVWVLLQVFVERVFGEKTVALAGPCTTSSTSSLFCTRSWNWANKERLDSQSWVVHFLLGKAGVHHVDDAINSQRSFSDVGRYHYFATNLAFSVWRRGVIENSILLLGWKSTVKWDDWNRSSDVFSKLFTLQAYFSAGRFNFLFTSQKEKHISRAFINVNLHHCFDSCT